MERDLASQMVVVPHPGPIGLMGNSFSMTEGCNFDETKNPLPGWRPIGEILLSAKVVPPFHLDPSLFTKEEVTKQRRMIFKHYLSHVQLELFIPAWVKCLFAGRPLQRYDRHLPLPGLASSAMTSSLASKQYQTQSVLRTKNHRHSLHVCYEYYIL